MRHASRGLSWRVGTIRLVGAASRRLISATVTVLAEGTGGRPASPSLPEWDGWMVGANTPSVRAIAPRPANRTGGDASCVHQQ